jgi:nucleoside 2-deoxyribosyltransferase
MANLNDFRGPGEPDSGTAFEVGFAGALGKPVWGYRASAASLIDHIPSTSHRQGAVCDDGFLVEDFEMRINRGPQECLGQMRASGAFDCPPFLATKCTKLRFVQNGECANSVYLFL